MSSEREKRQAIKALRDIQREASRRNNRIHVETLEDTLQRLRAIDGGICGNCQNINLVIGQAQGRQRVTLRCRAGMDPVTMYKRTPLGKEPNCQKFKRE